MSEENAVIVENLSKSFTLKRTKTVFAKAKDVYKGNRKLQKIHSLNNISITIPKGQMLGIIGLNGSGKTTLLRTIAGVYRPESGSGTVNGRMGPLLQIGTGFHPELNAQENIVMYGLLLGLQKHEINERINSIIEFAELQNFTQMKLKNYSAGMKTRLGFSTALQVNPDILLVDEVLAVGDMAFREKISKAFLSFKEKGKTILYTTHNMKSISELSDRVLLLDKGKIIMIGEPKEVIQKYMEIVASKNKSK